MTGADHDGSGVRVLHADWPAPATVRGLVTERVGGVSEGRYAGLNLATGVGDSAAQVAINRARLKAALALPREPLWLAQVHGTRVQLAREVPARGDANPEADAAVTFEPQRVLAVLTADCLPVVIARRDGTGVGIAHAGWRGLCAGVVEATCAALGAPAAELVAWLGPAIGPAAFEVGREVRAAFIADDAHASAAFAPNARGRWQADLYALARRRLARAGVTSVTGGGLCTYADSSRWYSFRRDGPTGRMATLAWLDGRADTEP